MVDLDSAGEAGAQHVLFELAKLGVNVRLGWATKVFDGTVKARQPEELTEEEWDELRARLAK